MHQNAQGQRTMEEELCLSYGEMEYVQIVVERTDFDLAMTKIVRLAVAVAVEVEAGEMLGQGFLVVVEDLAGAVYEYRLTEIARTAMGEVREAELERFYPGMVTEGVEVEVLKGQKVLAEATQKVDGKREGEEHSLG